MCVNIQIPVCTSPSTTPYNWKNRFRIILRPVQMRSRSWTETRIRLCALLRNSSNKLEETVSITRTTNTAPGIHTFSKTMFRPMGVHKFRVSDLMGGSPHPLCGFSSMQAHNKNWAETRIRFCALLRNSSSKLKSYFH